MGEIAPHAQTMGSFRKTTQDLPLNQTGHRIQPLPLQSGPNSGCVLNVVLQIRKIRKD